MKYRLGLDLGSNSIGWCVLELARSDSGDSGPLGYSPSGIVDAGVRILTPNEEAGRDPKSKASLAANRRAARGARRRRDRYLRRKRRLMETLVEAGLMPSDVQERKELEKLDPYWLRAAALDQPLPLHEIGRAVFHLNQRRGFRSNRIADSENDEKSAMKTGIKALNEAIKSKDVRTLGEFLAGRHRRDRCGKRLVADDGVRLDPDPVRFRPTVEGSKNIFEFFPQRELIASELDEIWKAQEPHHDELTDDLLARLKRIIIEQRPLKKPQVGRCTLRPEEDVVTEFGLSIDYGERTPKAHPLFQRFRILQDVAQLRVFRPGQVERPLTKVEHQAVVAKLMQTGGRLVEFEKLRKAAKLPDDVRFNYELAGRKGFEPDQTAKVLSAKKAFGRAWRGLNRECQIETVERLLAVESDDELTGWLCETFGIDEVSAQAISDVRLPPGHGQFGRSVMADLVAVMETETREFQTEAGEVHQRALSYNEAVKEIGLHHSDLRPDEKLAELPYYGEVLARQVIARADAAEGSQERTGRVPNPTVHIGINQLRKIVNALIAEYGPPSEIVIELARELKLSRQRKDKIRRENQENEDKNEKRRTLLENLGIAETHDARFRLRLFDELPASERVCVYSGTPLSMAKLFDGSIDVDHILPHSKTLDDNFTNLVLCTREANRRKGNRAPADAWSGEDLRTIVERAERLLPKKAWRFQPDAMERFASQGGFLARQLTDTQHMSRLAKTYLEHVCDQVWAPPGRLTAMLRGRWGLNSLLPDHNFANVGQAKNRKDHRHHAIDAFVVGCTDRGLLHRMATASGRAESLDIDRLYPKNEFPEPYEGFREDLSDRLDRMIVSHKPDHGIPPGVRDDVHVTSGELHEGTAYGMVKEEIDGNSYNLVTRKPIADLKKGEIGRIRDPRWRVTLQRRVDDRERQLGKALPKADLRSLLKAFGEENGVRRMRVLKTEQSVITVRHSDNVGNTYLKAHSPGDNHRIEIFELSDGTWDGEGVTVHDANRPGYEPAWRSNHPDARLVMRIHNGDLIEADFGDGGGREIYRVCRLAPSAKRINLVGHNEAGSIQERHDDPDDPLRWRFGTYTLLRRADARRVRVDSLGRVQIFARPGS